MRIADGNHRMRLSLAEEKWLKKLIATLAVYKYTMEQFGYDLWKLPVCEKCEAPALWDRGENGEMVGTCPNVGCGHTTKAPITVEQYLAQQLHRDRIMAPNAPRILERKRVWLPREASIVYRGEAGIDDRPHEEVW